MWGIRFFSVAYVEFNIATASLRADTLESASPSGITCPFDAQFQAVRKKTEGIEQRTFANSILSYHRGNWSQGLVV